MSLSSAFQNLRAGPVVRAGGFGLKDATIRKWVSQGLKLADRETRDTGAPRYDLADAARLFMLDQLTRRARMDSAPAIRAVNCAWTHLALIASHELDALDDPTDAPATPRYELQMLDATENASDPVILLVGSEEYIAQRQADRGLWLSITMDLREIVREARNRLAIELGVDMSHARFDFADA